FTHSAPLRRHWARPCPLPQARAHDGRRRDGGERAGQGFGVYRAAAGLAKATAGKTGKVQNERRALVCVLIKAGFGRMSALGASRTRQDGGNDMNAPDQLCPYPV